AAVDVNEIPTISDFYRDGVLKGTSTNRPFDARFNTKVSLIRCDIVTLKVDAIVNAADEDLAPNDQVLNERIHKLAGPAFTDECLSLGGCAVGDVTMTRAGALPCKRVIHAVRPAYRGGPRRKESQGLLENCYRRGLESLVENGLNTIAFPTLSAGGYGVPTGMAAQLALATVRKFLEQCDGSGIERVVFCVYTSEDEYAYQNLIPYVSRFSYQICNQVALEKASFISPHSFP
ncbi:macro domain-like protein, partial [Saccharata proteae CBS 121410]